MCAWCIHASVHPCIRLPARLTARPPVHQSVCPVCACIRSQTVPTRANIFLDTCIDTCTSLCILQRHTHTHLCSHVHTHVYTQLSDEYGQTALMRAAEAGHKKVCVWCALACICCAYVVTLLFEFRVCGVPRIMCLCVVLEVAVLACVRTHIRVAAHACRYVAVSKG